MAIHSPVFLEKEMAICSSILAWEIPWTEEYGGLESMGLQRVRHNLAKTRRSWISPEIVSESRSLFGKRLSQWPIPCGF